MRRLAVTLPLIAGLCAMLPAQTVFAEGSSGVRVVIDPVTGNVRVITPNGSGASSANAPSSNSGTIHLHMPRAHHAPRIAKKSAPPPSVATVSDTNGFSSPQGSIPNLNAPPSKTASAKPAATPVAKPGKPQRVATATPPPAHITQAPGRRIHILFPPGAPEPAPGAAASLKSVAVILNSSLQSGSNRVQLEAYGGKPNDTSSDARRLSLRRALAVRQLLIDAGLPSDRIDVHAMGGASTGSADRVDIFVHA